ncbi:MAG: EAL domain-containing protein [Pseudomonadota bacterium]
MASLTGWLIAGSMVVIAASVSAVLYFSAGLPLMEAGWIGVAALAVMLVAQVIGSRRRDIRELTTRLDDIGSASGKVSREMSNLSMRMADLEVGISNRLEDSVDERVLPLMHELQRIEERLRDIAEQGLTVEAAPPLQANVGQLAAVPDQTANEPVGEETGESAGQPHMESPNVTPLYRDEAASTPADKPAAPAQREGKFADLADEDIRNLVKSALDQGRLELFLQPMVTLPQRKVRYYEALARLRTEDDELMTPPEFLPALRGTALMAAVDAMIFVNAMQIARRLMSRNREVGLFINIAADTLLDERFSGQFIELAEHNSAVAGSIMLEMTQADFENLGPLEQTTLDQLADFGFRFSMDHVAKLSFDAVALSARHVRFVKVPAATLLVANSGIARDIHPADISDLLARSGIELVAERIERESEVIDLIDYDVRLAQGYLFSPPRPVRADLVAESTSGPAKIAASAE